MEREELKQRVRMSLIPARAWYIHRPLLQVTHLEASNQGLVADLERKNAVIQQYAVQRGVCVCMHPVHS
jgi:hypothetical protein